MNNSIKMLSIALGLASISGAAYAKSPMSNPIQTAVPFLNEATNARSAALGGSGVATSADLHSIYTNVAKTAYFEKQGGASLSYSDFGQKQLTFNSIYKLGSKHGITLGARVLPTVSTSFLDANDQLGEAKANNFTIDAGYAYAIRPYLSLGLGLHYIYSDHGIPGTEVVNTLAFDLGAYFHKSFTGFGLPMAWGAGLSLSNIGPKVSYSQEGAQEYMPSNIALGGSLSATVAKDHSLSLSLDLNKLMAPTPKNASSDQLVGKVPNYNFIQAIINSFADAPAGFTEELKEIMISTGIEYNYRDFLFGRVGYHYQNRSKGDLNYLAIGAGANYANFQLDLSYNRSVADNPLQSNYVAVSLGYSF
ncbi:MAG: type IX secretion system outer membrane channel protein PorV [Bacteroidales bacterium]